MPEDRHRMRLAGPECARPTTEVAFATASGAHRLMVVSPAALAHSPTVQFSCGNLI